MSGTASGVFHKQSNVAEKVCVCVRAVFELVWGRVCMFVWEVLCDKCSVIWWVNAITRTLSF